MEFLSGYGDFPSTSGGQPRGISRADMSGFSWTTRANNSKEASGAWCLVFFVCLFLGGLWLLERSLSAEVRNFLVFLFLTWVLGF